MDQEVIRMSQTETTEVSKLRAFLKLQPKIVTPIPNTPYPVGLRRWLRAI